MTRHLRLGPAAVMKSALVTLGAALLLACALDANVLAATPVDIYQDMENGNDGVVLAPAVMNASNHGGGKGWTATQGSMWISKSHARDLPGPVSVGGTTYDGKGGCRTWMLNDNNCNNYVGVRLGAPCSTITLACYYAPGVTNYCYTNDDVFRFVGGGWGVLQTRNPDKKGPYLFAHSCLGGNSCSSNSIKVQSEKTYWINLHYDGVVGKCFVAAFDPDAEFAQVGSTLMAPAIIGSTINGSVECGRCDTHGDDPHNNTQSYFGHICVDFSNGAFPLLPSGGGDSTAPSAPPAIRDGTGEGQSLALSTTQLSANWEPATDAESGIKGYQYAIGTTPGGANVADWTSIANLLGVTKTELSLTAGQTYYFSVKAVNGAGLVGDAATSRGQTVGTTTSPPSAPAAVRDGGMFGTLGTDCDQTGSTTELTCNFDPATDAECGIKGYEYAIGTTPGGTQTVAWTSLAGNAHLMYVRVQKLRLIQGQRYYFSVRAVNNAGLTGPVASSDGQVVVDKADSTPPTAPPAVRDGLKASIATTTSTTQLSANWDPASDPESGIKGYQYAIGSTPGGADIINWTPPRYELSTTRSGLSLTWGHTYYFSVRAVNGAGLTGPATTSNGQKIVSGVGL
jgi:hypothetical protein